MPDSPVLDLGFARLDLGREQRQGLAEVVYAPGKTREQITAIVRGLLARNTGPVLVTRVEESTAEAVRADIGTGDIGGTGGGCVSLPTPPESLDGGERQRARAVKSALPMPPRAPVRPAAAGPRSPRRPSASRRPPR